jgi:hypothetical protein
MAVFWSIKMVINTIPIVGPHLHFESCWALHFMCGSCDHEDSILFIINKLLFYVIILPSSSYLSPSIPFSNSILSLWPRGNCQHDRPYTALHRDYIC